MQVGGRGGCAIREMIVRGAPAIGQVAAIGMALTARANRDAPAVRPTGDAARRRQRLAQRAPDRGQPALGGRPGDGGVRGRRRPVRGRRCDRRRRSRREADTIVFEATEDHGRLADVRPRCAAVPGGPAAAHPDPLQHRSARVRPVRDRARVSSRRRTTRAGRLHVWVDETRPYLQGARLTAWELAQAGVPHTLIPDVAAGHLMAQGRGRRGPRRRRPRSPPTATPPTRSGRTRWPCSRHATASRSSSRRRSARSISTRRPAPPSRSRSAPATRCSCSADVRIAPPDTDVRNPAFDVTPAELITGIVTEEGVLRPPYATSLAEAVAARELRRSKAPGFAAIATSPAAAASAADGHASGDPRLMATVAIDGAGRRPSPA